MDNYYQLEQTDSPTHKTKYETLPRDNVYSRSAKVDIIDQIKEQLIDRTQVSKYIYFCLF